MAHEWRREDYLICTDRERLDLNTIHRFLSRSYWAAGIPIEVVRRSIDGSLCFGLYHAEQQIGFARVITDYATFGYLADVFVVDEFRGKGLGKWLVEVIASHPDLQGLRRWMLATRDAHDLYRKSGFTSLKRPELWMEKHYPNVYRAEESKDAGN